MRELTFITHGNHRNPAVESRDARRFGSLPYLWAYGASVDCHDLVVLQLKLLVTGSSYISGGTTREPDPWSRLTVRIEHCDSEDPNAAWEVLDNFNLVGPGVHEKRVQSFKRYVRARWCITRPHDDTGQQVFKSQVEVCWSLTGVGVEYA